MYMFKLSESEDFKKMIKTNKNRRNKARRKQRKREYKEATAKNAMDVVKAVSKNRKKARYD